MFKLYGFAMSPNSKRARWMLEELELPYESVAIDLMSGEQRGDAYRSLNPTGRVPTLVDGDFRLWESNAIVQYLAESHPGKGLAGESPRERAEIARWVFMNAAHLSPAVSRIFAHTIRLPEEQRIPRLVEESRAEVERCLGPLDAQLAGKEYLVGRFTVADVALAPTIGFAPMLGIDIGRHANIAAWMKRIGERPAWKRVS